MDCFHPETSCNTDNGNIPVNLKRTQDTSSPMWQVKRLSLLLLLICSGTLHAAEPGSSETAYNKEPLKIGLILSGGGARGSAHIGVLKVLEENHIPVYAIAGTSMGAVIGGLYASGYNARDVENIILSTSWPELFEDETSRDKKPLRRKLDDYEFLADYSISLKGGELSFPKGLIQGQNLNLYARRLTAHIPDNIDFDRLPTRFRAITSDIASGKSVVLKSGSLATAMRASMSIPGIFAPVELEGKLLVDGGISKNIPVDTMQQMGVDVLIVVDVGSPLGNNSQLSDFISITNQLTTILTQNNSAQQLEKLSSKDFLIRPELSAVGSTDFDKSEMAINSGYLATTAIIDKLRKLSVSPENYNKYLQERSPKKTAPPVIRFVHIENNSVINSELLEYQLDIQTDEQLELDSLEKNIEALYGLDYFESVSYSIIKENDDYGLLINAKERSWGIDNMLFGLELEDDFNGESEYSIGVAYRKKGINNYGAEWLTLTRLGIEPEFFTEFYQPLELGYRYFISPSLSVKARSVSITEDGDRLAEYRIDEREISLAIGRIFSNTAELRAGLAGGGGTAKLRTGPPEAGSQNFNTGYYFAQLFFDSLDSVQFPSSGNRVLLRYTSADTNLGADESYHTIEAAFTSAWHIGKNNFTVNLRLEEMNKALLRPEKLFGLGGFLNLSGYSKDEIFGQTVAYGNIIYQRRLNKRSILPLDVPIYFGVSLETGAAILDDRNFRSKDFIHSGSVMLGVETFLGPLYLAYGQAEENHRSVYFVLGKLF